MSDWRPFDSYGGVNVDYRKIDGKSVFRYRSDCSANLDINKQEANAANKGWRGDMHKVASVPLIVVEMWWKELGSDPFSKENRAWLIAKLNSREFSSLRTKEGRI